MLHRWEVAEMPSAKPDECFTYADYETWSGDARFQLVRGVPYMMSPTPTTAHQRVVGEIAYQLRHFLRGKPCQVFEAPIDVRLNADGDDDDVFQPDVVVVCDPEKIKKKYIQGAPDLAVEVISPSTQDLDRIEKYREYEHYGVREYWIADPVKKTLEQHILRDGRYVKTGYREHGEVMVSVLEGCVIDLGAVFG
ncbi:MAG: Uma2 family endonuclease [Acidobacteriota bacterium]|jgi:Uma2 family endonuclease|nr:Uma2 family endonuclease [Acidobacteriota bacterium]